MSQQNSSEHPLPSARRFRIGLRTTIFTLLLIACLGALQTFWLVAIRSQTRAAAEFQKLGGTVLWSWRLDQMILKKQLPHEPAPHWYIPGDAVVSGIYLTRCECADLDEKLAALESLRSTQCLVLTGTQVTDAGLKHLRTLASLENLSLADTRISDAGLHDLAELKNLKLLNLGGTRVTPAGIASLRAQLPLTTITSDYDATTNAT